MKARLLLIAGIVVLFASGCGNKSTESQSQAPAAGTQAGDTHTGESHDGHNHAEGTHTDQHATPPQGAGHAAVNVVPGSYEDWCVEHGVPESQCTRCDASLIPAFQAANDWCAEHGLPMSQCTIHNPNLKIVRPPKPEGK